MTTVNFDSSIYSKNSIVQSISAYKGYAEITISETATHIKCSIDKCIYDEKTTVNEFCNYVLGCVTV